MAMAGEEEERGSQAAALRRNDNIKLAVFASRNSVFLGESLKPSRKMQTCFLFEKRILF